MGKWELRQAETSKNTCSAPCAALHHVYDRALSLFALRCGNVHNLIIFATSFKWIFKETIPSHEKCYVADTHIFFFLVCF